MISLLSFSNIQAQTATQKLNSAQIDELFKNTQKTPELQALPAKADILTEIVPGIIKLALQLAGIAGFVMAIYAGILLVTARGVDDQIKKGKDILLYSVVAIVIISSAFAIVSGIVSFKF